VLLLWLPFPGDWSVLLWSFNLPAKPLALHHPSMSTLAAEEQQSSSMCYFGVFAVSFQALNAAAGMLIVCSAAAAPAAAAPR
jgi:hypothetical protein